MDSRPLRAILYPVSALVLTGLALSGPRVTQAQELIANGSFENPRTPPRGLIGSHWPGLQRNPSQLGWKVDAGNVEIVRSGYDSGAGVLSGRAAAGEQWLDLDGTMAGTISQIIATRTGVQYALSFSYANNPDADGRPPYRAHLEIKDSVTGQNLIDPTPLSHENATLSDFHWTASGAILFTARGTATRIVFASDNKANSYHGIFLDNISAVVRAASSVGKRQ